MTPFVLFVFGDQMTGLGARITALSAPFSAFAASGVQTASSFDVLMKQIELFGGVTGDELEAVRQTALQLGRDTKFSSQQLDFTHGVIHPWHL